MGTEWISSLSTASSINTVSADDDVHTGNATFKLVGNGTSVSIFPTPPPRSLDNPQELRQLPFRDRQRANQQSLDRTNSLLPASHADWVRPSTAPAKVGRPFENERRRIGWADDWDNEPMEQLRRIDHEDKDHFKQLDNILGFPRQRAQQLRPTFGAGLPTSYDHFQLRSRSLSVSASRSASPNNATGKFEGRSTQRTSTVNETVTPETSPLSSLTPSPTLHCKNFDRPWAHLLSDYTEETSRLSPNHSLSDHSKGASSSYPGHSYASSLAFSVATDAAWSETSCEPSRSSCTAIEESRNQSSATSRTGCEEGNISHLTSQLSFSAKNRPDHSQHSAMHQSQPDLRFSPAPASQEGLGGLARPVQQAGDPCPLLRDPQLSAVAVEFVTSPNYLEPYNSCEVLMFPRPRLRSRSVGTAPLFTVEKFHALPERLWQKSADNDGAPPIRVARMSTTNARNKASLPERCASSQVNLNPTSNPRRDHRLTLHENLPPPPLPKASPVPGPDHYTTKPLPPTPPPTTSPMLRVSQDSIDSLELLEASELLERNRELEQDRKAWREEYRTSLRVNSSPLFDRISPCLSDPSSLAAHREASSLPGSANDLDKSAIRVHRLWNKDGEQKTLLVVHARHDSPFGKLKSRSTPNLREGTDAGPQSGSLIKQLSQRLSSFATSKRPSAPVSARRRGALLSCQDSKRLSRPSAGIPRAVMKERQLVTDETIIIGRPELTDDVPKKGEWQPHEGAVQPGSQMVQAAAEPAATVARHSFASRSDYRPAGTRDEIKAHLGERPPSAWPHRDWYDHFDKKILSLGAISQTWIDPGSATAVQGELIVPGSSPARQPTTPPSSTEAVSRFCDGQPTEHDRSEPSAPPVRSGTVHFEDSADARASSN